MNTPRRATRLLALVLVTGAVATSAGCATGGGYPGIERDNPASRGILLRVRNNNWHDMRVYVISESGRSTRVGMVTGMSEAVLRIREPVPYGNTRVMLRPIGSRVAHTTQAILLQPGVRAELIVQNQITLSQLIAR